MEQLEDPRRRALIALVPLALVLPRAHSAEQPLLSEQDPAAKAVQYVEDASRARAAEAGATCANCSLYSAANGATEGPCTLFPGKHVKAAGWCSAWSSL